jgi:putative sigma-54 modulation protein
MIRILPVRGISFCNAATTPSISAGSAKLAVKWILLGPSIQPSGGVLDTLHTTAEVVDSSMRLRKVRPIPDDPPVITMSSNSRKKLAERLGKGCIALGLTIQTQRTIMSNASVIITGVHLDLTEPLKSYVNEKSQRLFRHNDRIVRVLFELVHARSRDHANEFAAQAKIEIAGPDIVVRVESDDIYKSIDLLMDKLDRALRRRHRFDKVKRHLGGDASALAA